MLELSSPKLTWSCALRAVSEVPELRAGACCAVLTAVCTPVVALLPRPNVAEAQLVLQQAPSSSQVCELFYLGSLSLSLWNSVFRASHLPLCNPLPGLLCATVRL